MTKSTYRYALLLLLPALLAGCGGRVGEPRARARAGEPGVVRFRYAGSGYGGAYEAQGTLELDAEGYPKVQDFAAGLDQSAPEHYLGVYWIAATRYRAPRLEAVEMMLSLQEPGAYPIVAPEACDELLARQGRCASLEFTLQGAGADSADAAQFRAVEGRVLLASVDDGRLRGTFTGTARLVDVACDCDDELVPGVEVRVTGGAFDVPVQPASDLLREPEAVAAVALGGR